MKRIRFVTKTWLVLLASALVLGACSKGNTTAPSSQPDKATATPKGEPVELVWHYPLFAGPQADQAAVEEAVNKIVKEKINATVKMAPFEFASYEQKMNTIVASNESYDIAWTANWAFNYVKNVQNGIFVPMNELLDKYAPSLKKSMPDFVWNATKVAGKIYAVPNYQTVTNKVAFTIQQRYLDKYPLDISKLKKLEDIEPYLEVLKKAEPKEYPFQMPGDGTPEKTFKSILHTVNLERTDDYVGAIHEDDSSLKAFNVFETPEFKNYVNTVHSWYQKGYIHPDIAIIKNFVELRKTGKFPVSIGHVTPPGVEANAKASNGGFDVKVIPLSGPYVSTNSITTTMQAISKTSKHPEKAMEFLNLVNTDKELYNLISYGIEGKHYTKVSADTIKINDKGGYAPNASWEFGNTFNGLFLEGQSAALFDAVKKENESAKPSILMGFTFNPEPVLSEIANIKTTTDELLPLLTTGSADPSKIDEFIGKLKKAGSDKVLAEVQKQLDEWKKTK
jgi:putative aldouronate transport system substrate-binding protein